MDNWYIKLHRKILDNPISNNIDLLGFISYILLRANHKANDVYIWNTKVHIEPWQFVWSILWISQHFWKSLWKIQRMLKILEDEWIAISKWYTKYSLFTVLNRHLYQSNDKQIDYQTENKQDTNKNDKNDKNIYPPDFEDFRSTYPHSRKWKKKESFEYYKKQDKQKVIIWSNLYSLEVIYGVQDSWFVPACERWIRDFTYSEHTMKSRIMKICEKMIDQWTPADKKRELQIVFKDYDIGAMFVEIRDRKKNLLIKSIKDEK